jgi:hypothetical protein
VRHCFASNGYHEGVERAGKKQPYFIHGDGLLSAAGLYEVTKNDGDWTTTYTIITTEAREAHRAQCPWAPAAAALRAIAAPDEAISVVRLPWSGKVSLTAVTMSRGDAASFQAAVNRSM